HRSIKLTSVLTFNYFTLIKNNPNPIPEGNHIKRAKSRHDLFRFWNGRVNNIAVGISVGDLKSIDINRGSKLGEGFYIQRGLSTTGSVEHAQRVKPFEDPIILRSLGEGLSRGVEFKKFRSSFVT